MAPDEYRLSVFRGFPELRDVLGTVSVEAGKLTIADRTLGRWMDECRITVRKPWSADGSNVRGSIKMSNGSDINFSNRPAGVPPHMDARG